MCLILRLLATPHYDLGVALNLPNDRVVLTVDHLPDVLRDRPPTITFTVKF